MTKPGLESEQLGTALAAELDDAGFGVIPAVLTQVQCDSLACLYDSGSGIFRKRIDMARYNFGRGEYQYFAYPLPELVQALRETFYTLLAPIANNWQ
ncbi:MAG: 2OG-Fe(II) oxygenase, partial [Proteobacteria bacterium]|nr:2OG-Fe(II) oxygenase [Pseudomonadota bacterium]